jgi:DoxX-like protein
MRFDSNTQTQSRKTRVALWTVQVLLAALFLFAGGFKLAAPAAALTAQGPFTAEFLRFIGVCETLGALGLILPGLLRIRRELTPLAAAGLVIIMVGATVSTLAIGGGAGALVPAIAGVLAASVAYGRRGWLRAIPLRAPVLQPAS